MWDNFKKWIGCATCVKATLTGLKAALVAAGPTIIELGPMLHLASADVSKWLGIAVTLLGVVLLLLERTSAAMVKDAKDIEGVQVHVDTTSPETPNSVKKLAEGPMSDVFPMIGGPRQPTDHDALAEEVVARATVDEALRDDSGYKTLRPKQ